MYLNFIFLDRFLFELSRKNTYTYTHTETHTHTDAHKDSDEYSIVEFCKKRKCKVHDNNNGLYL